MVFLCWGDYIPKCAYIFPETEGRMHNVRARDYITTLMTKLHYDFIFCISKLYFKQ